LQQKGWGQVGEFFVDAYFMEADADGCVLRKDGNQDQ
jgi:hypothetical protein